MNISDYIALLAVLVSLAAVVIGPFVTLRVSRQQLIVPMRQKWGEELRNSVSEYLSECRRSIVLYDEGLLESSNLDEQLLTRILFLEQKIRLMLSLNEELHEELMKTLQALTSEVQHGSGDFVAFGSYIREATAITQQILKSEGATINEDGPRT